MLKSKEKIEFGDFQTSTDLSKQVCQFLLKNKFMPASILEPTCGVGNFLTASLSTFPSLKRALGFEINPSHVDIALKAIKEIRTTSSVDIYVSDFFNTDYETLIKNLPEPVLILGNPPWATNSKLGGLKSNNMPIKSNFQGSRGIDALMGKSNFDISEWMLSKMMNWIDGSHRALAMLCKTSVARKVLKQAWKHHLQIGEASIHRIDASAHFNVSVDACLLVVSGTLGIGKKECSSYESIESPRPTSAFGLCDGDLIANMDRYKTWKHLRGTPSYRWRSGIKHDCSKIMELSRTGSFYQNGNDQSVALENQFLFPMLKSSQLANGSCEMPSKWMIVPQSKPREDTSSIQQKAPMTWKYLCDHREKLDARKSSIYRKLPRFSIFGVGRYSFAPWKIAVSGFYKHLRFHVVGSFEGKPIVLDDTCYFIPCYSLKEAMLLLSILNSRVAVEFLSSFIFWDAKRPITIDHLMRLDILAAAKEIGLDDELRVYMKGSRAQGVLSF